MGAQRSSFDKLQRDRAKKAKAAAKREQRLNKDDIPRLSTDGEEEEIDLLALVEAIDDRVAAGELTLEEAEEEKVRLLSAAPAE